jgi:Abortive infection C-terminus
MKLVRTLIAQNNEKYEHFSYYEAIIDVIEEKIQSHPDICIEGCKSLIEGVSKTIIKTLDNTATDGDLNKMDVMPLFKRAANKLAEFDEELELDFINRTASMIQNFGQIRNERGDISHGRAAPKEVYSSPQFSNLVARVTEALAFYVLEHFFRLQLPDEAGIKYEDNRDFNEMLDTVNPIGSLSFSKALFDQDNVLYCEQLLDYKTEREQMLEETIFENEPDN